MPTSETLKTQFLAKYGLDVTFEEATENGMRVKDKFKYVDSFLFETKRPDIKAQKYLETLMYLLNRAFERKLPPENSNKEYDVSDIDALEFVREYEAIMQAEHEEKNPGTPRKKNEGIGGMVLSRVEATMKGFNKPLSGVWADRIRAEIYNVDDLRRMTDGINERARDRIETDENQMEGELVNAKAVATACVILDAMEKAIDQRPISWYFWPGNWNTWAKENSYFKHLKSQVQEYRNMQGFADDVQPIIDDYNHPINDSVNGVTSVKTRYLQQIQEKKAAKTNANAKAANTKKEKVQEVPEKESIDVTLVQKTVNERMMHFDHRDKFIDEVIPQLPEASIPVEDMRDELRNNFTFCISKPAQNSNKEFVSSDGHPNTVKQAALDIFCETSTILGNWYPDDAAKLLLAAQIITDNAMKKYSAAGVFPKQYGEFAKGYAINHLNEMQDKSNYNMDSYTFTESAYQKAIESHNDLNKPQKLHIENLDDQKDTEISDQIKESSFIAKNNIIAQG